MGSTSGYKALSSGVLARVLISAGPRPLATDPQWSKTKYAISFADAMAKEIAEALAPMLGPVSADARRTAGSVKGAKQLDVNFSKPSSGLLLGMSLKSVHIREAKGAGRYTHNMKRNEEELRIEASGYHRRQPYAVLAGVLFLPFDSCDDAKKQDSSSSFGSWVRHLRPFAGRTGPRDDDDRFERIFICLYAPDGSDLGFFDVETPPPRSGRPTSAGELLGSDRIPRRLLTFEEFIDSSYRDYLKRNHAEFRWAEGPDDPLTPE